MHWIVHSEGRCNLLLNKVQQYLLIMADSDTLRQRNVKVSSEEEEPDAQSTAPSTDSTSTENSASSGCGLLVVLIALLAVTVGVLMYSAPRPGDPADIPFEVSIHNHHRCLLTARPQVLEWIQDGGHFIPLHQDTGIVRVFSWLKGRKDTRETVLLLPDVLEPAYALRKLAMAIAGHGFRVVLFDPLGLGLSDKPSDADTLSAARQTAMVGQVLRAMEVEYVHLIAHGSSAKIAAAFSLASPQTVRSVAYFGTDKAGESPVSFLSQAGLMAASTPLFGGYVMTASLMMAGLASLTSEEVEAYHYQIFFQEGASHYASAAALRAAASFPTAPGVAWVSKDLTLSTSAPAAVDWAAHETNAEALARTLASHIQSQVLRHTADVFSSNYRSHHQHHLLR